MTDQKWEELLKQLKLVRTNLSPVDTYRLDALEHELKIVLPQSYRSYCSVFGPGEISECFRVAVPGYTGESVFYNLWELNSEMHHGREWEEYSPDPDQFERAIIFANDIGRNIYFWDPKKKANGPTGEYEIFVTYRDWETRKLADTFWELVTEVWLGKRHSEIFEDEPALIFQPAL